MIDQSSRTIPFASIKGLSNLAVDYYSNFDALTSYYAADYRSEAAWSQHAEAVLSAPRPRERLVEILLEQNSMWASGEEARANIEKLRSPEAAVVVTGQQVGLLLGPLYTMYKTLTTVQLARRMESVLGRPVVPVFWLEGDDHDFAEVSAIHFPVGTELRTLQYRAEQLSRNGNTGPVGRIVLDDQVTALTDELEKYLQHTEHSEALMRMIRSTYKPGETFRDAFARLMNMILPGEGLVFVSSSDARLKSLAAPLFRREIDEFDESSARIVRISTALEKEYHAQVYSRPTNIFMLEPDGRYALEPANGLFRERGSDRTYSRDDLLSLLERAPQNFSANVALRPLMQDTVLPTLAYVAGPGEIAYFAQYKALYEWAGIPMPIIYPRISVTLLEPHARRVVDKYGIEITRLQHDFDQLFKEIVLAQMGVDLPSGVERARRSLNEAMDHLEPIARAIDPTLVKSAEATRSTLLNELERIEAKLLRAEKRNHDQIKSQLERARTSLFPDGGLQERKLSLLYFLNKYGVDLPKRWIGEFSLDTTVHHVVDA